LLIRNEPGLIHSFGPLIL